MGYQWAGALLLLTACGTSQPAIQAGDADSRPGLANLSIDLGRYRPAVGPDTWRAPPVRASDGPAMWQPLRPAGEAMATARAGSVVARAGKDRPVTPASGRAGNSPPVNRLLVPEIQERLRSLGFYAGPVDGMPGPVVQQAAAAFRRSHDLPGKGMDDQLLAALRQGSVVREIQHRLFGLGYAPGRTDGIRDRRTVAAIATFLADYHLPPIGWSGHVIRERLREAPYLKTVRVLLQQQGYETGPPGHLDDPVTRQAIRAFEAGNGLPVAGRPGHDVHAALARQARRGHAVPVSFSASLQDRPAAPR